MQWWEKRNKKELQNNLFQRNLANMRQRFGNNSYAATMAARETAKTTNPQGLAIHDEEMRRRRAQQIEEESNRTALELAKEKLRRLKAQGIGE